MMDALNEVSLGRTWADRFLCFSAFASCVLLGARLF